jgi:hypothetical protein
MTEPLLKRGLRLEYVTLGWNVAGTVGEVDERLSL